MWYHAGRRDLRWGVSLIAARFALCFLAASTILTMSLFRFSTRLPLVGMFQVCRKGFPRACWHVYVGADVSIMLRLTAYYAQQRVLCVTRTRVLKAVDEDKEIGNNRQ